MSQSVTSHGIQIQEPPVDFQVSEHFQGIYLFHRWELFPGVWTDGPKDINFHLDKMNFPSDLRGKRVLDIAPWNGFFSFECIRRGAKEVVSFGPEDPLETGYEQTRSLLGIQNCRWEKGSIYDLSPEKFGQFDVILFLGLIYHLRHPLYALDRVYDVLVDGGTMYCDTPYIDHAVFDQTIPEHERLAHLLAQQVSSRIPMTYFTPGSETGDPYNWFMPNFACFRAWITSSGFDVFHEANNGENWGYVVSQKGVRPFEEGLEGFNRNAPKA
ncbi:tRNA (mo5U34)-methyltransferase [Sphingobium sp. B11D3B]|uniref:DUF1698 domain-containing protein n=1 Tax=Sphingobium sp. B11D3B TaxID=2940575 RepID=UPI002227987B|nr:DUF1698 domain-containing protein [Sphingobium sp. B11D3B]MCW2387637.1 tRNA (mo5U34)-methyltransferase [Sphingobium sp. B11D3B]